MLTAEKLREILSYNPMTGEFLWLAKRNRIKVGDVAGTLMTTGYIHIKINNHHYLAHRLAWFYTHKVWPTNHIDHDDNDRSNNRLRNLREATYTQNAFNVGMKSTNTSGFKGVSFSKSRCKFIAAARINGVNTYLGAYATPEEASEVYQATTKEHRGIFQK